MGVGVGAWREGGGHGGGGGGCPPYSLQMVPSV